MSPRTANLTPGLNDTPTQTQLPACQGARVDPVGPVLGAGMGVSAPRFLFQTPTSCDRRHDREPARHKGAETMAWRPGHPAFHAHAAPGIKELSLAVRDLWAGILL